MVIFAQWKDMENTMYHLVTEETLAAYEDFLQAHPQGNFAQSYLWGKQKPMWSWHGIYVKNQAEEIIGAMSVLIRKVPGLPQSLMYGCRAPVCDLDDFDTMDKLLQGAKDLAKKHHCYVIKIDPDVPAGNTAFAEKMTAMGFRRKEGKNFEAIQPQFVFRMDILGKTQDEILASFHQKTRYNIRVAIKKGVEVKLCGKEMVPDFARIMLETGVRDGFVTRQPEYFSQMLDNLGEHCRLYMAFHEGKPIAGTLAIAYGDKVWYLYGASSNQSRNLMPNYLLQWNMIQWAQELGCRIYDFRGVSGDLSEDNPLYGLYKFKKGFNGEFTEFIGELDLVLNKLVYTAVEKGTNVMKDVRKKRYLMKHKHEANDER